MRKDGHDESNSRQTRLQMQLLTGIPAAFLQLLYMAGQTDGKIWQM